MLPWEKIFLTVAFLVLGYFSKAAGRLNNEQPFFLNDLALGSSVMLLSLSKVASDLLEGLQSSPVNLQAAQASSSMASQRFEWFFAIFILFLLSLVNDRYRWLRPKIASTKTAGDRSLPDVLIQDVLAFVVLLGYLCLSRK